MKYKYLFTPIKINNLILKNRIVASPINDEYEEKATGGAGLVVCGHTIVEPGRSSFMNGSERSAFFKYEVEKTQQRIRACHKGGARASIEIFHAGLYARVEPGDFAWGPCGFIREDGVEVKQVTEKDMDYLANLYAKEALEAKNLGFDAIFLHFGHGWLPAQFLSPLFNHRTDEYGGCLENRAKFPLLILKKIREAVSYNFPIEMRISAEECVPGSIKFDDTLQFILMAESYIDSVQISAGLDINHEGNVRLVAMNYTAHMPNAYWAAEVKKHVKKIKVSVVGSINTPDEAESLIASGSVDLVAFGRSFIADPNWPNKARDGKTEDIVPCLRCNQCYHITTNRRNVGCSVNPRYHNETLISKVLSETTTPKNVVVVGGGPAGITCAITASKRGHNVTLLEKNAEVGGTLNLISQEHYKEDIRYYTNHLKGQLAKSNVIVKTNCEATPELVKELHPDALVLALGGEPVVLPLPGVNLPHVFTYEQIIGNEELLGEYPLIIGGGTIGTEIAIELSELHHKEVTIVEIMDELALQGNMLYRIALRQKMACLDKKVSVHLKSKVKEIKLDCVLVEDEHGTTYSIKTDSIVLCTGVKAKKALAEKFYGIVPEIYEIGDMIRPRLIQEANFEGRGVGETI